MSGTLGRPSLYSDEIMSKVFKRVAQGESLRSVCRDKAMPCIQSILTWIGQKPGLLEQYEAARQTAADVFADEIVEIADEEPRDENGKIDPGAVQRNRLRVDARKWIACKLKPKRYGDRVEHTGEGASVTINLVSGVPQPKTIDTQAERDALPGPDNGQQ